MRQRWWERDPPESVGGGRTWLGTMWQLQARAALSAGAFCTPKEGHKQPPASPSISVATSRRAEEHEGGAGGTGETPAAFSGLPKAEGTSAGRILTPARAFSLAPVLYRGFGDLSWGGASINLDYWDISLNISCLTEDKLCGGQFRRCTTTRQPPH